MAINPSRFNKQNVTDTCSVWNVLSSTTLFRAAKRAGVQFCCTSYVIYECLYKPRKVIKKADEKLQKRLISAQKERDFKPYSLEISDLQTIEILQSRKRLGMGELSSIAFAMKTRQSILTDDMKAKKVANEVMPEMGVQTTPHLFGWLIFHRYIIDSEKDNVVKEHKEMERPLSNYFEEMYLEALRCSRLNKLLYQEEYKE